MTAGVISIFNTTMSQSAVTGWCVSTCVCSYCL